MDFVPFLSLFGVRVRLESCVHSVSGARRYQLLCKRWTVRCARHISGAFQPKKVAEVQEKHLNSVSVKGFGLKLCLEAATAMCVLHFWLSRLC